MSILATIKFIVIGKSVDFKNHEGSSPSIPKKTVWLPNSLLYPFDLSCFSLAVQNSLSFPFTTLYTIIQKDLSRKAVLLSHHTGYIWYMYKWTSLSKESPCEWFTIEIFIHTEVILLPKYRTWMRLCNTLSIDIDPRCIVKWKSGCDIRNSWDSSVGRAEDWKSSCHQFKSGSWHRINLYESLFY